MDIPKLIREIHKQLNYSRIPFISKGGCGYVAFFIANELERYDIPYKIRVVDRDLISIEGSPIETKTRSINDYLANKALINSELISFIHCWIEIEQNGKLYALDAGDYEESHNSHDYQYSGFYTKKEMKMALRFGGWNQMYNIKNNKSLRNAIRKAFESVHILRLLPTI